MASRQPSTLAARTKRRAYARVPVVTPKVIIRHCDSDDPERIRSIVREGLETLRLAPHVREAVGGARRAWPSKSINRAYLAWKASIAAKRVRGRPSERSGATNERGAARPASEGSLE